ncbi:hypothetical protein CbuQ229_09150 [Coxiella burnetii]|nr:hypothetical protein CbuQ229_09150 [Coxiella burnetii]
MNGCRVIIYKLLLVRNFSPFNFFARGNEVGAESLITRRQRTEDRRQWLCRYATTKFYKLMLAKPHNSVFSPLSSALHTGY